jgi:hypothetical protein
MARFGKKAELESQKSTKEVECVISVSDDNCSFNAVTGKPISYYVEAQRLQDQVDPEDAKAGKADSNPYITNKKEYYMAANGERREKTSHIEQISVYGMEQIKQAAHNEFDTIKKVFDAVTGEEKEKVVHNYIVKLNIGFGGPGKPAFFYVPKAVNKTQKEADYSFRNMPKRGRELTQEILDKHNEITNIAKEAAQELYTPDGQKKVSDDSPNASESEQEPRSDVPDVSSEN